MTPCELARQLDPFTDGQGETYFHVTVDGTDVPEQVSVESRAGQDVLRSLLAEQRESGVPTDHEVKGMACVLRGFAFRLPRREPEAAASHLLTQKPLAQAVLAIARDGGTRADPTRLLAKLNHIAHREGIDTRDKPWPRNEDALGRQLSGLLKLLAGLKVVVVRNENDRPRTWTIPPATSGDGSPDKVTAVNASGQPGYAAAVTSGVPTEHVTDHPPGQTHDDELDTLIREVVAHE